MIRGEGTEVVRGVTPKDVWEFVLDPAQYTKADTKIIWVTKLAETDDGMIGLEEGKFFGMRGSVVTRYRWTPDYRRSAAAATPTGIGRSAGGCVRRSADRRGASDPDDAAACRRRYGVECAERRDDGSAE